MTMTFLQTANDIPVYHAVESYTDFVAEWSEMAGTFPAMVDVPRAFQVTSIDHKDLSETHSDLTVTFPPG